MKDLEKHLKENPHKGCNLKAFYDEKFDSLTRYLKDVPAHAEHIDNELTLFRCLETNEIVGFEISGIKEALKREIS